MGLGGHQYLFPLRGVWYAGAGIPVWFTNIEIPWADGPRTIQSGDVVIAK